MENENGVTIYKVTVECSAVLHADMLDVFNTLQGLMDMGHDDGKFILSPTFNIEIKKPA